MIPLDILRVFLGFLCLFFAHFLGRSIVRLQQHRQRARHMYGWLVRMVITLLAVLWRRGFDSIAIAVVVLSVGSAALGMWDEYRPKHEDDLTRQIFGE